MIHSSIASQTQADIHIHGQIDDFFSHLAMPGTQQPTAQDSGHSWPPPVSGSVILIGFKSHKDLIEF